MIINYNGKQIRTKKDMVLAIFDQAGVKFEASKDFWHSFNKLD